MNQDTQEKLNEFKHRVDVLKAESDSVKLFCKVYYVWVNQFKITRGKYHA